MRTETRYRLASWVLLATALLTGTGCTKATHIRASEVPKLGTSQLEVSGATSSPNSFYIRDIFVEKSDGALYEVKGRPDIRITRTNGYVYEFAAPIRVDVSGDGFEILSKGRSPITLSHSDIFKVEVIEDDPAANFAVGLGISVVAVTALTVGLLALLPKSSTSSP
jgi:hypothetical protein